LFRQVSYFFELCGEIGPLLLVLGLSGALLQISIFVTISKCGALNCALFGVSVQRKKGTRTERTAPLRRTRAAVCPRVRMSVRVWCAVPSQVARKITTLIVSIVFFHHKLSWVQSVGLAISIYVMLKEFTTKRVSLSSSIYVMLKGDHNQGGSKAHAWLTSDEPFFGNVL
jgi:hypothetical protein